MNKINEIINSIKDIFLSPLSVSIFLSSLVYQYFFEWWSLAISAFLCAFFIAKSASEATAKGTATIATLWLIMTYYQHISTQGILSEKIAQILPVNGNVGLLIAATTFIGSFVGGIAAMSGFLVKDIFNKI